MNNKRYAIIDRKGNIMDWENEPSIGAAIIKSKAEAHKALKETQKRFAARGMKSKNWEDCKVVEVSIFD